MKKEIIENLITAKKQTGKELEKIKRSLMSSYRAKSPNNISLLKFYHEMGKSKRKALFNKLNVPFSQEKDDLIKKILTTRPVRSLSGIVNVSVLTKPYPCPGKCIFCPQEDNIPKSYLKNEPAVMRAIMNKYSPRRQVNIRIEALKMSGHPVDKIELRIIGGTWSYYPKRYQKWFIKECFQACNNFNSRKKNLYGSLEQEHKRNEKARHRVVGLSVETRPDFIDKEEIKWLRSLGVTSVELGVQSIYDDVLKKIKRGHTVSETIKATKLLKDAGIKVSYQMMPNLPGSTLKRDIDLFKTLFSDSRFQPDYLKIYPMAVIKNTEAYKLWINKRYKPYSDLQLKKLFKEIKKNIPRYVRIQRLIRDIPAQDIEAGTKISNLRQIVLDEMKKENISCKCIRCREVKEDYNPEEKLLLFREDYLASQGKEVFLSYEDKKRRKVYSILRLRLPSFDDMPIKILDNSTLIREVHTYGQQISLKEKGLSPQHKGLGKKLIKEAERISKEEFGIKKIAVISSVGTRDYYRKLNYRKKGDYLFKDL